MIASCPDCRWTVEADDTEDAQRASLNHWSARHALPWCRYCQHDTGGPRRDHDTCIEIAVLSYA